MQLSLSRFRTMPMLLGFVALSALAPLPAATISTFNFTGTCSDCDGLGKATLVLQDYTQGNNLQNSNLVSFTYAGTNLLDSFTILPTDPFVMTGIIPASLPGPADFTIFVTETFTLNTSEDTNGIVLDISLGLPFFTTSIEPLRQGGVNWEAGENAPSLDDFGTGGTWNVQNLSDVPEPSSVILIGAGLLAIGLRRFKR